MAVWWDQLELAHRVFYAIAISTTFLLGLQMLLTLLGADVDGDMDVDVDMGGDVDGGMEHGDAGVGIISFRTITAFFTGFGWGGVGALNAGWSLTAAIFTALASGVGFMGLVIGVLTVLFSFQGSGNIDYRNALGEVGRVYVPIAPSMQHAGQVEVLVQGRLVVVPAFTRTDRRLSNEERVRVTEVLDRTTLVVEPLNAVPTTDTEG